MIYTVYMIATRNKIFRPETLDEQKKMMNSLEIDDRKDEKLAHEQTWAHSSE